MLMGRNSLWLAAGAFALTSGAAFAQDAADAIEAEARLQTVVVTGVVKAGGQNRLDSSISVSSLDHADLMKTAPRSTSEIFRALPGIRAESSAGGGNSNIAVRGMPLSTGGAKYVSLQEDGLPILLFGDFDFAPADGFYKVDTTLDRVESVRGGTASTLTTNGPGGIINFISKTGSTDEGSIALTTGLDHDDYRADFEYGGTLTDSLYFHIGGHWQQGGDYRDFGFDAVSGGQIRASLTRQFETGFVRVSAKWLDKAEATHMPQAAGLSGNNVTDSIAGFSASGDSLHNPYIRYGRDVDGENTINAYDLADGIRTEVKSLAMQANFDLGADIVVDARARYQDISGNFNAPFTHLVVDADTLLDLSYGGAAASLFNGPGAGNPVTSDSLIAATGNPYISDVTYFNTDLDDLSNFAGDLRASKSFDFGASTLDVTLGYFFMDQTFAQDWHWNRFLTSTSTHAALINVEGFTDNGILGYNQGFGWTGNNRNYDLEYQARAPYVAASWSLDTGLTLDGSVRLDTLEQTGTRTDGAGGPFDVDGDGLIDAPEAAVSLNTGLGGTTNFEVDHTAFTIGANYLLSNALSVFGRYSEGAAFNGERQLFTSLDEGGRLVPGGEETYVDETRQFEAGLKWQEDGESLPGQLDLYFTYFNAETKEDNYEITTMTALGNTYVSQGVETEFSYSQGGFDLTGSVTFTDAEIDASTTAPAYVGNTPRRQADWIWSFTPSYTVNGLGRVGMNFTGTTDAYVDDDNVYILPGATVTNLFAEWDITEQATLSIGVNNVFDKVLFTEAENGRAFDTDGDGTADVIIARSINGRSATATFRYRF
ncbi:MAG: TonB-dependent receptor [Hyphomonadaceae bacterium]|jgi:outer membrane receptor protein involved in Fe transport|nr:TonB-dependent receptor [Hyphomonadaceae bacterium]MBA29525.1 TonB-dependent receptor [Hyphomonadaceae bacterium]|tara:strand:- start:468233 stop:470707 length:2475 start_codon:yes stop_codon:yes gene_type:complete